MMGHRQKLKDGFEWDVLFGRKHYCYLQRAGAASSIKRRMRRRDRRDGKHEAAREVSG